MTSKPRARAPQRSSAKKASKQTAKTWAQKKGKQTKVRKAAPKEATAKQAPAGKARSKTPPVGKSGGQQPKITPALVAAHGLKPDEYERLRKLIGRTPTFTELGIFSAMWNEHCSYKSSKIHLRTLPT